MKKNTHEKNDDEDCDEPVRENNTERDTNSYA